MSRVNVPRETVECASEEESPCLGLDIGRFRTRVLLPAWGDYNEPSLVTVPTVLGYSSPKAFFEYVSIGDDALEKRDHLQLVRPLSPHIAKPEARARDFARRLRDLCGERWPPRARGVVNLSFGSSVHERLQRQRMTGELFERVAFAEDTFLAALGTGSLEVTSHSIVVDVGQGSTRLARICGEPPKEADWAVIPYGSGLIDDALRVEIERRYPELVLTDWTLCQLKEKLAFVAPAGRQATLELRYKGARARVEVTELVEEACSQLIKPLKEMINAAFRTCPSDEIRSFQQNIVLAGGGAKLPGLRERLERELLDDGCEFVRLPETGDADLLVVRGAARWASLITEKQWGTPVLAAG